jgi:DNA polymerase
MSKKLEIRKGEEFNLTEVNLKTLSKNVIDSINAPGNVDPFVKDIIWYIITKIFSGCDRCHADAPCEMGTPLMGYGNREAKILILGEAPGEQEDLLRQPFVGQAGLQLQAALDAFDLKRESDLYICNSIICRPTKISSAKNVVNRKPTQEELDRCKSRLLAEISLVEPEIIVCFGATARRTLTDQDVKIGDMLGLINTINYSSWKGEQKTAKLVTTYHPSYLLYASGQAAEDARAAIGWALHTAKEIAGL